MFSPGIWWSGLSLNRSGSGPLLADELVRVQTLQRPQSTSEVVGSEEVGEVALQLGMIVVVEALDGGVLDGAVHPLHLPIGPRVLHLGQTMLDAVLVADAIEDVVEGVDVAGAVGELDAIVGQNGLDGIGDRRHQIAQELSGLHLTGCGMELGEGEFGGAVDGHEEGEFALGRLHAGDIDVEVADRVALEPLLDGLVAFDIGETRDAMALKTAV